MKKLTVAAKLAEIIFNEHPEGFFEIVQVNKGKGFKDIKEHFCGVFFGWEKELSALNFYVNEGYTAIGIKITDNMGRIISNCSDYYIHR